MMASSRPQLTHVSHQYAPGEDLYLDMHVDDSEVGCSCCEVCCEVVAPSLYALQVTVNVNLLDTFEGAGLAFCGRYVDPSHRKLQYTYEHVKVRRARQQSLPSRCWR